MKEIDWANLSFGYMKTDYNVRCYYRDGAWGELELCSEETLNIHMDATCLQDRKSTRLNSSHYQQSRMPSSA